MTDSSSAKQGELALSFAPKFDDQGLLAAITVDAESGDVLMFAFMNAAALEATLTTRRVHYWSRSRQELWCKGETSGNTQEVVEILIDCDQDALVIRVHMNGDGVACHTGARSCFYRSVELGKSVGQTELVWRDGAELPI